MSEEVAIDDQSQSHYEISLTAGQAFVAFVLLLLSLAASFAFGLMISRAQPALAATADAASVIQKTKQTAPVQKADIAVKEEDFKAPAPTIEASTPMEPRLQPGTTTK